jgi:hypothetical protein
MAVLEGELGGLGIGCPSGPAAATQSQIVPGADVRGQDENFLPSAMPPGEMQIGQIAREEARP